MAAKAKQKWFFAGIASKKIRDFFEKNEILSIGTKME